MREPPEHANGGLFGVKPRSGARPLTCQFKSPRPSGITLFTRRVV
jgi:hypothetical protein